MRQYDTGATRSSVEGKLNYIGFLDPRVEESYAKYMHKHRIQEDGKVRSADNWKKGMPQQDYIESSYRHYMDWWFGHIGLRTEEEMIEAVNALIFNAKGYLLGILTKEATVAKNATLDLPIVTMSGDVIDTRISTPVSTNIPPLQRKEE